MKKTILITFFSACIVAFGASLVFAAFDTTTNNPNPVFTGTNATSTTATAQSLVAADIVGYTTLSLTPTVGKLLLTLPASSTLSSWLPNAGNTVTFNLFNASSTAGIDIGLYAGSGTLIQQASSTATTTPSKYSEIRVMRKPNTDLLFTIIPAI